ncbi:MAG: metallophosphoesterase [Acidobacteriia bacterium]|nr:metallophosphoesterase [Terriglobia bacterium]
MRLSVPALLAALALAALAEDAFRFVLIGDRTGEAAPGIYERVWQQAAAANPAFVLSAGDTIEGLNDATASAEWLQVGEILKPYQQIPLYLTPGNHDIWSALSEELFRRYARHPPHYSFDYAQAHFTILDNSRSEQLPAEELAYLEKDLEAHAAQPLKFVVSHRPFWLLDAAFGNREFPFHKLAKRYGVRYVLAGHLHQMLHIDLDGITYVSLPSAGGHLRVSGAYEDGWFFGHTLVEVRGMEVKLEIQRLNGERTRLEDWGYLGLIAAKRSTAGR